MSGVTRLGHGLRAGRRGRVRVIVLGSGDAFHSGGRRSSSYVVGLPRGHLLVDCGPTTPHALHAAGIDPADIRACLITHFHGDHFLGLPMLCLHKQVLDAGGAPLAIVGPRGLRSRLRRVYAAVYAPSARKLAGVHRRLVTFHEVSAGASFRLPALGATVRALAAEHTREALSFRVTAAGRSIAFTGDTAWSERLPALARGTDLCLCECTAHEAPLPGHLSYAQIAGRREALATHRLVLSHIGRDPEAHLGRYAIEVAHDGMVITL